VIGASIAIALSMVFTACRSAEREEGPVTAVKNDAAVALAADACFPFALVAETRDEWGWRESPFEVPFGAADGAMLTYYRDNRHDGPRERFEWMARAGTMEIDVGMGRLRRVLLRSGVPATIEPCHGGLEPGLDGAQPKWQDDHNPGTPYGAAVARGIAFAERVEAKTWSRYRGSGVVGPGCTLRGRVFGRDGPCTSSFCVAVRAPGRRGASTSNDGSYELKHLQPGEYEVIAGSIDGGDATARVTIGREDAELDLQLEYGPSLRGRVVDGSGAPVNGAQVLWWTPSGAFRTESTDSHGTFFLPRITDEPGQLWVCVPGETNELPAVGRSVAPGDVEFVLDRQSCAGSLRVPVAVPEGIEPDNVSARIWQMRSGIGVRLVRAATADTGLVFGRDAIPAGDYQVELYCPGLGRVDAGIVRIDGVSRFELRGVVLPTPVAVTFTMPEGRPLPANDEFDIVRRGRAVDHRLWTEPPFAVPHRLGPGDYLLFWREGGEVRQHPFVIDAAAGAALTIRLP
jgi:hypothetical protein